VDPQGSNSEKARCRSWRRANYFRKHNCKYFFRRGPIALGEGGIKTRSHLYISPRRRTSARRSSQGAPPFLPTGRPLEIYWGTGISGILAETLTQTNVRPPGKRRLSGRGILNPGCTPAVSNHEGFTKGSTWKLNKIYRETPYRPLGSIVWGNYLHPALCCRCMAELVPVQAGRSRLWVESL
jgi:hypothetical protein